MVMLLLSFHHVPDQSMTSPCESSPSPPHHDKCSIFFSSSSTATTIACQSTSLWFSVHVCLLHTSEKMLLFGVMCSKMRSTNGNVVPPKKAQRSARTPVSARRRSNGAVIQSKNRTLFVFPLSSGAWGWSSSTFHAPSTTHLKWCVPFVALHWTTHLCFMSFHLARWRCQSAKDAANSTLWSLLSWHHSNSRGSVCLCSKRHRSLVLLLLVVEGLTFLLEDECCWCRVLQKVFEGAVLLPHVVKQFPSLFLTHIKLC